MLGYSLGFLSGALQENLNREGKDIFKIISEEKGTIWSKCEQAKSSTS